MKKKSMNELGRLDAEAARISKKLPVSILLDNVRSAYNVGSCFRTSDAFGVNSMILGGYTAQPPHREIMKTALGSTESVEWEHCKNPLEGIEKQKKLGSTIVAIEQVKDSVVLQNFLPEKNMPYTFVFGNEAFGVSDEVLGACDLALEIPQFGFKHSLNVAVSLGIVLWDFYLKTAVPKEFFGP